MDTSPIEHWLQQRFRRDANVCVMLSPFAVLGGLLTLFLTFWFAYAAAYLGEEAVDAIAAVFTDGRFQLRHTTLLWLAGGFLIVLITGYLRQEPFHFHDHGEFSRWLSPLQEEAATYGKARSIASPLILLLFPQASSRMVVDILFTGPRLLFGGWGLLRESGRLRTVDLAKLAPVLAVLAARDGRVGNDELVVLCPGLNFVQTMSNLQLLPGVVPLQLGLSLTAEFRAELRALA